MVFRDEDVAPAAHSIVDREALRLLHEEREKVLVDLIDRDVPHQPGE
jgi:hypothetical protein